MFDPRNPNSIQTIEDKDLSLLPEKEDDWYEYKRSATKDLDLKDKITQAASGFWNTGGGLLVLGVDNQGQPDGGISLKVGRASRRDWIDQQIARVQPCAYYVVQSVEDSGVGLNIKPENAVFLISFGESEMIPHMAPDFRHYIRAGAHTVPANSFIVDALYARRGLRAPRLRHSFRRKPDNNQMLQLVIENLSPAAAIDVLIELDPLPTLFNSLPVNRFPLQIPTISQQSPFFSDIQFGDASDNTSLSFVIKLVYFDIAQRQYEDKFEADAYRQMGLDLRPQSTEIKKVVTELDQIGKAIKELKEAIKSKK